MQSKRSTKSGSSRRFESVVAYFSSRTPEPLRSLGRQSASTALPSVEKNAKLPYGELLLKLANKTEEEIKEDHKTRIRKLDEKISALCAVLNT